MDDALAVGFVQGLGDIADYLHLLRQRQPRSGLFERLAGDILHGNVTPGRSCRNSVPRRSEAFALL